MLGSSQSLFREGDKEGDSLFDYGTLRELSDHGLVDSVLGSGTKQGYTFAVVVSPSAPESAWMATASPAVPQSTGDRYFATSHEGVIFYTTAGAIPLDPKCVIPPGPQPVGK